MINTDDKHRWHKPSYIAYFEVHKVLISLSFLLQVTRSSPASIQISLKLQVHNLFHLAGNIGPRDLKPSLIVCDIL